MKMAGCAIPKFDVLRARSSARHPVWAKRLLSEQLPANHPLFASGIETGLWWRLAGEGGHCLSNTSSCEKA